MDGQKSKMIRKVPLLVLLGFAAVLSLYEYAGAAISKQYLSDQLLRKGLFVSVGDNGRLMLAQSQDSSATVGVVSEQARSADGYITEVVTEGKVSVIASNANGSIQKGDKLMLSQVAGVVVKAVPGRTVVAIADEELIAGQQGYGTVVVELSGSSRASEGREDGIRGMIHSLAGKPVSDIRIVLAFLMFGLAFVVAATLISSSASSSISAIGRNPLAKISIINSFSKVLAVGFVVITLGLVAAGIILIF